MKVLTNALKGSRTIVFFDFEGTQFSQEIVALGAIKVDIDEKNQIMKKYNSFKVYIKANDKIGPIVSNITGLTDKFILENGIEYKEALDKFQKYIGNISKDIKFISYGNFDMRLLHCTNEINNITDNELTTKIFKNYIDFSSILKIFVKSYKNETLSLVDALKVFKVTPKKDIHNPETDAINLMMLYEAFLKNKKILKEEYTKVIQKYTSFPAPIAKTLSKLYKEGKVTIDDFNEFIEDEL